MLTKKGIKLRKSRGEEKKNIHRSSIYNKHVVYSSWHHATSLLFPFFSLVCTFLYFRSREWLAHDEFKFKIDKLSVIVFHVIFCGWLMSQLLFFFVFYHYFAYTISCHISYRTRSAIHSMHFYLMAFNRLSPQSVDGIHNSFGKNWYRRFRRYFKHLTLQFEINIYESMIRALNGKQNRSKENLYNWNSTLREKNNRWQSVVCARRSEARSWYAILCDVRKVHQCPLGHICGFDGPNEMHCIRYTVQWMSVCAVNCNQIKIHMGIESSYVVSPVITTYHNCIICI